MCRRGLEEVSEESDVVRWALGMISFAERMVI